MASALTPTTNDIPGFAGYPPAQPAASGQQVNVAEAIWRYRWAVMIPVIVGAVCGLLIYLQLPETYRSTTRLMIESDNAAVLDQLTGEVMGGVPSIDIVKSQLFSDRVMAMAFAAPRMQPFREDFTNDLGVFASDVLDNMELEPEVEDLKTAQSLVMLLHFDNENEAMVKEAVTSFSESLQRYYNDNYKSGRNDLRKLVRQASEELYPQLLEQERRYGDFRRSAPLVWDSEGRAINPHRERMMALLESRSELSERVASKKIELAQLEQIAEQMKEDPENALGVVGELLEKKFTLPSTENRLNELQQGDFVLAETLLKEDLLPLSIERAKLAEQFNENHPSVKALDVQIEGMREEMAKLLADRTDRVKELIGETMADPRQRATEAMKAIILAASSEVKMLEAQSELLREQWVEEQRSAVKLAQFEMDDEQQRRSIERTRELLDEMENKLAAFNMDDEDRGTRVVELKSPTQAYQVGPSILKTVGVGGVLGILLGCGLAMLLEKNANTFRDSDEIADTLGTPVLTHVPFYKGRVKKGSKSEPNPYEELDPSLAVIHMPAAVASEAIRSCRTNLFFELSGKRSNGSIIQVTSPLPGDGKSTIAGNLACSIAQAGKRTLLIDCDLRRPQMTDNFGLEGENGLTNA
ncbi:MAG: capsular biosynthesis protein, partial [Planctomycetota bacterium]